MARGSLTRSELKIGRLIVVDELDREEIAAELSLSVSTVRTHITRILDKCALTGSRTPELRRAVRAEMRRNRGLHTKADM